MNISDFNFDHGIFALILIAPLFLKHWISVRKAKLTKQAQDQLVDSLVREGFNNWCRVYVARAPHFSKSHTLVQFEARGVLVNLQDQVRLIAEFPSGERLDKTYPKENLRLRWIGKKWPANSSLAWIAIGSDEDKLMLSADAASNALQSSEATADMCLRIDTEFRLPDNARSEFALEKNLVSLTVVLAFLLLLTFALVDGIALNKYKLLATASMQFGFPILGLPALMLCVFPVYRLLARAKVPVKESLTLSLLVSIALCLAYVPAIKRIDQLLSDTGFQSFAYRLEKKASLEPLSSGPPRIDYAGRKEYWAQFNEGSIHHFDLVHGPLGLWQLDHSESDQKMRQFYEERRKEKKALPN